MREPEEKPKKRIQWHRLFGLTLIDLFTNSNFHVELEKELSIKKQFLDIAIIKQKEGIPLKENPVGFENLIEHNLVTYKSLREPLDDWTIEELIGYYANYRKIVSPSLQDLLPVSQFKLYAICTRYPVKFLQNDITFTQIQTGVYELIWGKRIITIIVLSKMTKEAKNAIWQLFSGKEENFIFGNTNYKWRCPEEQAVLKELYQLYKVKGDKMPYSMEQFSKDFTKDHLHLLNPSDVLTQFSPDDVLTQFSPRDRLKGLAPSDRLKGLAPTDVLTHFSPGDRLKGLAPDEIREYLAKITKEKKD